MREIKFRGRIVKGIKNAGSWVYWGLEGTDKLDVIERKTIGQYTGLKDKQGKEIYEGDILKFSEGCLPTFRRRIVSVVKEMGGFRDSYYKWILDGKSESFEVIGNIYENPELCE